MLWLPLLSIPLLYTDKQRRRLAAEAKVLGRTVLGQPLAASFLDNFVWLRHPQCSGECFATAA